MGPMKALPGQNLITDYTLGIPYLQKETVLLVPTAVSFHISHLNKYDLNDNICNMPLHSFLKEKSRLMIVYKTVQTHSNITFLTTLHCVPHTHSTITWSHFALNSIPAETKQVGLIHSLYCILADLWAETACLSVFLPGQVSFIHDPATQPTRLNRSYSNSHLLVWQVTLSLCHRIHRRNCLMDRWLFHRVTDILAWQTQSWKLWRDMVWIF
jgi:hypothetical protein